MRGNRAGQCLRLLTISIATEQPVPGYVRNASWNAYCCSHPKFCCNS